MALLENTQKLLGEVIALGINSRQIAEESSGTVNHEWLKKFVAGKIDDPGVRRIESLAATLLAIKTRSAESEDSPALAANVERTSQGAQQ
jgi:hypothetical protein